MAKARRRRVWDRAGSCCEYCQLPQSCTTLPHEIDHIRAQKHHGRTTLSNLCLACAYCNSHKGTNAAGYNPATGQLVPMFNPRRDDWYEHFTWNGAILIGETSSARATIDVLRINAPDRITHRRLLIASSDWHPG
jgi:hypothetical protein